MLSPALMISSAAPAPTRPGTDAPGASAAAEPNTAFSSVLASADSARQLAAAASSDSARTGSGAEAADAAAATAATAATETIEAIDMIDKRDRSAAQDVPANGDDKETTPRDADAAALDSVALTQQSLVDIAAMLASLHTPVVTTRPAGSAEPLASEAVNGDDAPIGTNAGAQAGVSALTSTSDAAADTTMRDPLAGLDSAARPGAAAGSAGRPVESATTDADAVVAARAKPASAAASAATAAAQVNTVAAAASATSPLDANPYRALEAAVSASASEPRAVAVNGERRGRPAATAGDRGHVTSATAAPSDSAGKRISARELQAANANSEGSVRSEVPLSPPTPALPMAGANAANMLRGHAGAHASVADVPFQAQLSAALNSPQFAPALGVQLSTLMRNGIPEARLHLHPAELGPIAVQIELDGRSAQIVLAASHAETRQALEQAMPQLASALRDAGFTMTGGGVFQQPPERQPPRDSAHTRGTGRSGQSDAVAIDGGHHVGHLSARVQQGVVDLYA